MPKTIPFAAVPELSEPGVECLQRLRQHYFGLLYNHVFCHFMAATEPDGGKSAEEVSTVGMLRAYRDASVRKAEPTEVA